MAHLWTVLTGSAPDSARLYLPSHDRREFRLHEVFDRASRTAGQILAELDGRAPRRLGRVPVVRPVG